MSDLNCLLEQAVKCSQDDFSVDIQKFDGKGEGFCGDLLFVTLTMKKTKEKKLLCVKQQKLFENKPIAFSCPLFDNEIYFYTEIGPTMKKFYQESTGKTLNVIPNCYATSGGEFRKIVLENLLSTNFVMYDKTKPFDDDHFSYIFNVYGIYHGISMALRILNVEEYEKLSTNLAPLWNTAYGRESYAGKVLMAISRSAKELFPDKRHRSLIEKLQIYENDGPEIINNCFINDHSSSVLLHGDCWSNNFMFKYGVS